MQEFTYDRWRHGGWYVNEVHHINGGVGCVSRSMCPPGAEKSDGRWRIACDSRSEDHAYASRDEAARAEREQILVRAALDVVESDGNADTIATLADILKRNHPAALLAAEAQLV